LNAFSTYLFAIKNNISIDYHAIEAFPLEKEVYTKLNYTSLLQREDFNDFFIGLHESEWNKKSLLQPGFSLQKFHESLQNFHMDNKVDLVYFDAFAPRVQPELWTAEVFSKMYESLNPGGILVTYCAKGEVKRNMKAAGFNVEALPGPKGKREMTRAIK
jgi:tRNA U34 5-methylaminomethyl-2-thiouridine-forming methyltransferase MnmC